MIYSIYFSPTGGTKKVADILTSVWPEPVLIDLCLEKDERSHQFTEDDIVIVSVPSYGGRVPNIAVKRLQKMSGNGAKTILNVVYGNRHFDDTLLELKEVLSQNGFSPKAAITAIAEHSIVREIAANRPDEQDQKELLSFAQNIKDFLDNQNNFKHTNLQVDGSTPYKEYNGVPLKPKTGKNCNKCGICAEHCPVGAIPKNDPKSTDTQECISCMGCIAVCPQQARKVNPLLLKGASVSLKPKCMERRNNTCVLAE